MANTIAPKTQTYQTKRVGFYKDTNKRTPPTEKDRWFKNVFLESDMVVSTGEKLFRLKNRGGLEEVLDIPVILNTTVRGVYSYETLVFIVAGNYFIVYDGAANSYTSYNAPWTNTNTRVGMTFWSDDDEIDYILIATGTELYMYDFPTHSIALAPATYPTPHHYSIQNIDGYICLLKEGTGEFYNSQQGDLSEDWDFLAAEMYPDSLVCLSRYNNYLVGMGKRSVELFYDAAVEEGSPFQRNDSTVVTVGCASPDTVVQTERQLFWVGTSSEGQLGVWVLEKFDVKEVSTPLIRKVISQYNLASIVFSAFTIRHMGRRFYVLALGDSLSNRREQIWVYDINENFWYQWEFGENGTLNQYLQFGADLGSGEALIINNLGVYRMSDITYLDIGQPMLCEWQTDPQDFGNMNRKVAHRLTMVGNYELGQQINLQWSDDDFNTWSPVKTINMDNERPAIVNMGMFRRRAWRFTYTQNLPLVLDGIELYYNQMGN